MAGEKVEVFKLSHEGAASLSESNPIHRQDLITSAGIGWGLRIRWQGWHQPGTTILTTTPTATLFPVRYVLNSGRESVGINPGDVFHVPRQIIHRAAGPCPTV
jgi:hypothetical protein